MKEGNRELPIPSKYCLTVEEAACYFNIGDKKLRKIISEHMDSDFVIQNGVKLLIKRRKFEEFLDKTSAL